jgi:hypothetical protein
MIHIDRGADPKGTKWFWTVERIRFPLRHHRPVYYPWGTEA